MANKFCKDCIHFDVPELAYPCNGCKDHNLHVSKHYIVNDTTNEIIEFIPKEEPANIHKKPSNLYEGIDEALLKRIRHIMNTYLKTNRDIIDAQMLDQIKHDIAILTNEIGDAEIVRQEKLKEDLQYVLGAVADLFSASSSSSLPRITQGDLSNLLLWAAHEAFPELN